MPARDRTLTSSALRFLLVGAAATVVDVGLFNLLHVVGGRDPVLAKAVSTVAAAVVAFVGNRLWVFERAGEVPAEQQVLPYVVVNVVSLPFALLPIQVARGVLALDGVAAMNVAANVVGLALATCVRFYGYRRWVFTGRQRVA